MNCEIENCGGEHYARGWCHKHYERWRRHGSTDNPRLSPEVRFSALVDRTGECWRWMGRIKSNGYGALDISRKTVYAHRFSYELHSGPIPHGIEVDHICHNPACVRPSHLRLATSGQNGQNRLGAQRNSPTGVRGVTPCNGRFRAQFQVDGKRFQVGMFDTIKEAEVAVSAARREHMTHSYMDRLR